MLTEMFDAFKNYDWAGLGKSALGTLSNPEFLKGAGTLAGAWGQYSMGKEQNKMLKDQFSYAKEKDDYVKKQREKAQSSIDQAFAPTMLAE